LSVKDYIGVAWKINQCLWRRYCHFTSLTNFTLKFAISVDGFW